MGLTPEKAAKCFLATPRGRFAFFDETRGEPVKPDDWKPLDFRSLIKKAQTKQMRVRKMQLPSLMSCVEPFTISMLAT